MKSYLRLIMSVVFIFCSLKSHEQQAQFETAFYFEDAFGNRDTVIIGADSSADELVNTHLGEMLLTNPWDSIFEVRVAREDNYHDFLWFGDTLYLYNKRITHLFNVPKCGYSTSVIFLMHTTHYPVTVTWDTLVWSYHNSPCPIDGSFFHHTDEVLEPGWWPAYSYACLRTRYFFEFDITDNEPYSGIIDSIMGVGMSFIYGLQLNTTELGNPISPCNAEVGLNDPIHNENFVVYPNPSFGSISIKLEDESNMDNLELSIRNCQGIEVMNISNLQDTNFPILLNLLNGIYFASIIKSGKPSLITQKIIVKN